MQKVNLKVKFFKYKFENIFFKVTFVFNFQYIKTKILIKSFIIPKSVNDKIKKGTSLLYNLTISLIRILNKQI